MVGQSFFRWEVVPLLANILSTVAIVFVNKYVMAAYPFSMAITLIHQIVASAIIIARKGALRPENPLPFLIDCWIGLITVGCIYFANQSLRINSVTLYQISKLLNIPTMCLFQYIQNGKTYSAPVYLTLVALTVGVGAATLAEIDVAASVKGLVMAGLCIVVTVVDQMEVGRLKNKHETNALDFLHSNVFHRLGVGAIIVGAFEQESVSKVMDVPMLALVALFVSCLLATSINLTQVVIIGKFGPMTMQVVGHAKTTGIMALSLFWIPPEFDILLAKKIVGIVLAMGAAIKYGQLTAFPDSSVCGGCLAYIKGNSGSEEELEEGAESPKKTFCSEAIAKTPRILIYLSVMFALVFVARQVHLSLRASPLVLRVAP